MHDPDLILKQDAHGRSFVPGQLQIELKQEPERSGLIAPKPAAAPNTRLCKPRTNPSHIPPAAASFLHRTAPSAIPTGNNLTDSTPSPGSADQIPVNTPSLHLERP